VFNLIKMCVTAVEEIYVFKYDRKNEGFFVVING